jgi:hypothetical protein
MGLIALGVGYLVLLNANKEKEGLRLLGQAVGILIMIAAILSSICMASKCMSGKSCGKQGMMAKSAPMCPMGARDSGRE